MLLKLMLALVPFLLLNDAGGAGGEGDGGEPSDGTEGTQGDSAAPPANSTPPAAPSANKLIKDFAADRGISVEDLLTQYQQLEDAGKTETERLTGERDGWKSKYEAASTELRNTRSEAAFLEAAREARARAPKTLFRAYRDQLEYDKAGNPTNIAEVIAAVKGDEPDLFAAATGTSDAGRKGDGGSGSMTINDVFREMAERR